MADVETGNQDQETRDGQRHAVARDGVHRQENAREQQRRSEISLQEKQQQGRTDPDDEGQDVFEAWEPQPSRQRVGSDRGGVHLAEQLPSAGEVASEKQRQQQADQLDRLHRPEIHLGPTRARSIAEGNECCR